MEVWWLLSWLWLFAGLAAVARRMVTRRVTAGLRQAEAKLAQAVWRDPLEPAVWVVKAGTLDLAAIRAAPGVIMEGSE